MATVFGAILGIKILQENPDMGIGGVALVTFTMPAYTASSDNGQLGGGGFDRGVATTAKFDALIAARRRDGKTLTLNAVDPATTAESGLQGSTQFYANTFAISSNNMTFNLSNVTGTEIDAASGVSDRPISIAVGYSLS